MERFKIGDMVVCKLDQVSTMIEKGDVGVITSYNRDGYDYYVDFPRRKNWPMYEFELAHDKEHKVLQILKNYRESKM